MSKPDIHARNSARRYGGLPNDYIEIHNMMDSSKAQIGDSRHRVVLHTTFGCFLMERMFGVNFDALTKLQNKYGWTDEEINDILEWKRDCVNTGTQVKNSEGRRVSVRNIAEEHIQEDYAMRFIPTLQDFMCETPIKNWMLNGKAGLPPSFEHAQVERSSVD